MPKDARDITKKTGIVPFTLTLLVIVSGIFIFLLSKEQLLQDKMLKQHAREIAVEVKAVRGLFAEKQELINSDSHGNYEFKGLSPAAATKMFITKINDQARGPIVKQTSSLFRKQEDKPDAWERSALKKFQENPDLTEIAEKVRGDTPQFRYAEPLYISQQCLPCHGGPAGEPDITGFPKEGYRLGELRGALSITFPLKDYYATLYERILLFCFLVLVIMLTGYFAGKKMLLKMQQVANTDFLTHIYNRNILYKQLKQDIEKAAQNQTPMSILMFDIDHFKRVNDTFGHLAGDAVLKQLVETAAQILRKGDTLVRFGGEEFLIITADTDHEGAAALGERLRSMVENAEFFYEEQLIKITVSVGLVTSYYRQNISIEVFGNELLKQVDAALYRAKEGGRNRVVASKIG